MSANSGSLSDKRQNRMRVCYPNFCKKYEDLQMGLDIQEGGEHMRTKKYVVAFILVFLFAVLGMPKDVMAATGTCDGGKFVYNEATGTLTISGSGEINDDNRVMRKLEAKHLIIQKGVTAIGNYAFQDWEFLESVELPEGLTQIGYHAFAGCEKLTSITIPSTVTATAKNIGGRCFWHSGLQTITFAEGTTVIPHSICGGAENLTTVNLPRTVTEIQNYAFSGCTALEDITLYDKVTSIGKYDVFKNCNKLVMKGYSGSYAHKYAQKNNISFVSIGNMPPKKGTKVTKSDITYKITSADINGKGAVTVYKLNKNKKSVTIPKTVKVKGYTYKVTGISSKAFYKKSKVKTISIKSATIQSIGKNAFKGISRKAVIKVPSSKYKAYKKMLTAKTGFAKKTMKVKK